MTQRTSAASLRRRPTFLLALAAALLPLAAARPAAAQETPRVEIVAGESRVEVRLRDGSTLIGRIVEATADRVVVVTQGGTRVEVERAQVVWVRPAGARVVDGEVWPEDPNATRLFLGPTARSLPAGRGYFGVFELVAPTVAYGVTDRFTLAGGTLIIPDLLGRAFFIAPKLEVIRTPQLSAAVGALAGFAPGTVLSGGSLGLLYGVGTLGGPDRSVTVGASFPFYTRGDEGDVGDTPAIQVGGELRLTSQTKLITENYFFPGEGGTLVSGGVRFFGERLSADVGLGVYSEDGAAQFPVPIVNFVYTFGKR